jgi:hypothetical protein
VPTSLPKGSKAAATWLSRWVSTPPVTPGGASHFAKQRPKYRLRARIGYPQQQLFPAGLRPGLQQSSALGHEDGAAHDHLDGGWPRPDPDLPPRPELSGSILLLEAERDWGLWSVHPLQKWIANALSRRRGHGAGDRGQFQYLPVPVKMSRWSPARQGDGTKYPLGPDSCGIGTEGLGRARR